jgi:hypothetical protein
MVDGFTMSIEEGERETLTVSGLVSDDVASVAVRTKDGAILSATMGENAYVLVRGSDTPAEAIDGVIVTFADGRKREHTLR